MNLKNSAGVAASLAFVLVAGIASPTWAQSDKDHKRQRDKNTTRNIAIGAGAGAVIEALKGHRTSAVLLGAGAVYAAKKSNDARKAQNRDHSGTYRVYRYRGGKRVGYTQYRNGERAGYHRYGG